MKNLLLILVAIIGLLVVAPLQWMFTALRRSRKPTAPLADTFGSFAASVSPAPTALRKQPV